MKKFLSLTLALVLVLSLTAGSAAAAFTDQGQIQHREAVEGCAALHIIHGYPDGSFGPNGTITRAELCKMVCTILNGGQEPAFSPSTASFTDVETSWAKPYIEYCYSKSIVSGVGGGRFAPDGSVTVDQAAKMLLVCMGYNAWDYIGSVWAQNVRTDAQNAGLFDGMTNTTGTASLTRDDAAQMIWNALHGSMVKWEITGGVISIQYLNESLLTHCYPNGFFPETPVPDGKSKVLADYMGMTKQEIARLWGSDYILEQGGLMGAEQSLYYDDVRVPAVFYLHQGVVAGVDCVPSVDPSFRVTPGITGLESYAELSANGIDGRLITAEYDPYGELGMEFEETAAFYHEYQNKLVYFSWLDRDPYTSPADSIIILNRPADY